MEHKLRLLQLNSLTCITPEIYLFEGLCKNTQIEALLNNGATQKYIAQRYKTSEVNLSLWLAKHGLRRRRKSRRG
jgi:hypothetical protein